MQFCEFGNGSLQQWRGEVYKREVSVAHHFHGVVVEAKKRANEFAKAVLTSKLGMFNITVISRHHICSIHNPIIKHYIGIDHNLTILVR